jgi:tRNA pseudouridine38-40 synthase
MRRALFTIQYLGTRYAGWQTQHNAVGVQQVLEQALARLTQQPAAIHGAGRTDSGVHAEAQRAHADIPNRIDERGLILGMNDLLPRDIRLTGAEWVSDRFHARFDAVSKSYVYRIWNAPVASVFHDATHEHVPAPLNIEAMAGAATALKGRHDFRAFTVAEPEVSSTIRTLLDIRVEADLPAILITISADGFLRYMARRIAGSLIEIGRGKLPGESLARSLEPAHEPARWTAPAHGLTLQSVSYEKREGMRSETEEDDGGIE